VHPAVATWKYDRTHHRDDRAGAILEGVHVVVVQQ